eukprot:529580-Lingulodinium_polyedra.AAC.1
MGRWPLGAFAAVFARALPGYFQSSLFSPWPAPPSRSPNNTPKENRNKHTTQTKRTTTNVHFPREWGGGVCAARG